MKKLTHEAGAVVVGIVDLMDHPSAKPGESERLKTILLREFRLYANRLRRDGVDLSAS
jgi:hypothetical protein